MRPASYMILTEEKGNSTIGLPRRLHSRNKDWNLFFLLPGTDLLTKDYWPLPLVNSFPRGLPLMPAKGIPLPLVYDLTPIESCLCLIRYCPGIFYNLFGWINHRLSFRRTRLSPAFSGTGTPVP